MATPDQLLAQAFNKLGLPVTNEFLNNPQLQKAASAYTGAGGGGGGDGGGDEGEIPWAEIMQMLLGASTGGGGGAPAFASTEAGMRLQAQLAGQENALDRTAQFALQSAGFDFQDKQQGEQFDFTAAQAELNRAFQQQMQVGEQQFTLKRDIYQGQLQQNLQKAGFDFQDAQRIANEAFSTKTMQAQQRFQIEESAKEFERQQILQESGFAFQGEQAELGRAFEGQQAGEQRRFQAGENAADRALRAELAGQDIAAQKDLQASSQTFQAGENAAQRALQERLAGMGFDHDTAERIASQTFQADESERDREFRLALQREGFDFQSTERIASQAFNADQQEMDRELQRELQTGAQEFQREITEKELGVERQRIFADLMGRDPVRAVLFALGGGTQTVPGAAAFEGMAPIEGSEQYAQQTGQALSQLTGKNVNVTKQGVQGLGGTKDLLSQARKLQAPSTSESAKTLLSSAFGVGSEAPGQESAGITPEDIGRLVTQVTPMGGLPTRR